ncbi:NAD-dependent succinate-semialdehyde dehydrogenase [Salinisphaera hydrothermalis]|uniref:Succinate semialdehyde dehydrogenase n=1 Tax=Salinisphaera hydrothermalis (strain C41B8) TaxID=1304275 RepID=A0A084IIF1_SALHC|nr:NAD-dependent succinate-semialdehyde dehydrogenase [Salinisphaera hydrothermalis]KEZ76485.1 succinate semialdehyde dehydrogenase [Salinisphaera hydrothermalis C41B8]
MSDYQALMHEAAYIGGQWIQAGPDEKNPVRDPANGELLGHVPALDAEQMDSAIDAASAAFDEWRHTAPLTRADRLYAWYEGMQNNREALARLMTLEQGKPINEARGEVDYASSFFRWFAEEARRFRGKTIPAEDPTMAVGTVEEPVGVAAIITPWNFPLAMITRKVGAALAAGCTTLVNPATETAFCALALADLAEKAGLTNGEFNVVPGSGKQFGERVCADDRVRALSFTGSTEVGRKLIEQSAATVKKNAMELGGNAPFIVCEDADLETAVDGAIAAKFQTTGQDCVAANRIYVHRSMYEDFVDRFVEKMNAMPVGHGLNEDTKIGPLIHADAVEKAQSLVDDARERGARIIGREQSEAPGENFFMPTVVADFTSAMRVAAEEQFAPVAPITPFDTDDEALAAANDTIYGLASYVFSPSDARIRKYLRGLEYGMVGINTMDITGPHVPFGGVKQSGLGREGGHVGMAEYLETKYYCMGNLPKV